MMLTTCQQNAEKIFEAIGMMEPFHTVDSLDYLDRNSSAMSRLIWNGY